MSGTLNVAAILGRDARPVDLADVNTFYRHRSVLVAGAGGRLGSALVRAIGATRCARLAGLDSDEHALVDLLGALAPFARDRFQEFLCNVRDARRLKAVFSECTPDVIFHVAGLRNLAFCERHAGEAVLTNLAGVRNMADAAEHAGASRMVLVSSDKAAAPSSLAGACLRLAELHLSWRDARSAASGATTRFAAVRTGNVFGSRGSVIQTFRKQIAAGGPVTLTHKAMRRYFMTVGEAVSLILLAGASEAGGGGAYLLDVGHPVFIRDLAARMIALSGKDVEIVTREADGSEKLEEDLYDEFEQVSHSGVEGVLRLDSVAKHPVTTEDIDALEALARTGADAEVREGVFALLTQCLGRNPDALRIPRASADFADVSVEIRP